ncbi:unnamed protein product [Thlaspi arvense]|uniref:PHD finger protein MALE STERILITY 1-like ubiquitin-like domain-containing protein n=1 Tax=Thlaspi arvense TaxID=13288 RepID=A0AAU9R6X4_THLAR|nr:unnamed protein product [Thlaspi arvense]
MRASNTPPFRDGVRSFFSTHARVTFPASTLFSSLMMWKTLLRHGDSTDGPDLSSRLLSLEIVEEDVTRSSRSIYCDHCQVVGWSSNPVCRKRYHFIIRSGGDSKTLNIGLQKACSRCGNTQNLSEGNNCKWCSLALDTEDWVFSQLEDTTHLLHGVIHSNGYAHLLSLNDREGGSGFLAGRAIMDFWDRLCTSLAVRKASVMDVSRKYGIDYRLLHGMTRGCSWYSEWGYEFKSGSYALTREVYESALSTLSAMPLSEFMFQGRGPRTQLHSTIGFYQSLSCSELVTVRDLFSFLVQLIRENRSRPTTKKSSVLCAWTRSDVERVQQAMVKILKAAVGQRGNWGVLSDDGSQVVCSHCNSGSNDFEYRLEPVNNVHRLSNQDINYAPEEQIKCDLRYLYDTLLNPQTMAEFRSHATRDKMIDAATKILDCKHFIKDYLFGKLNPFGINLWCHVELSDESKDCPSPPPELLVLPLSATVSDLKSKLQRLFRKFDTNGVTRVNGRCSSKHGLLRYRIERGVENWKVDWKCAGIENSDELPSKFHCFRCNDLYSKRPKLSDNEHGASQVPKTGFVCRGLFLGTKAQVA